jgi:hypothetical protein
VRTWEKAASGKVGKCVGSYQGGDSSLSLYFGPTILASNAALTAFASSRRISSGPAITLMVSGTAMCGCGHDQVIRVGVERLGDQAL